MAIKGEWGYFVFLVIHYDAHKQQTQLSFYIIEMIQFFTSKIFIYSPEAVNTS